MRARSIRTKIARRAALGLVAASLALGALRWPAEIAALEARHATVLEALMRHGGRDRCEAAPAAWRGDVGPGTEAWAFDRQGRSANPAAPPFDAGLGARLARGERAAWRWGPAGGAIAGELAAAMPWGGPCAVVVLRWSAPPGRGRAATFARLVARTGVLAALAAAAVALSAWPEVGRLRRLAARALGASAGAKLLGPGREGDEIDALAASFDAAFGAALSARAESEARRAALEEFVARATHDLLTPLSVVKAELDEVERAAPGGASAVASAALASAADELDAIDALVGELASSARGAVREPVDAEVELGAEVELVVQRHRRLAARRRIDLDATLPEAPVRARLDPLDFRQALVNLVGNAVRHGREGGYVAVSLSHDGRAGRFAVEVSDDGDGTPAALRAAATLEPRAPGGGRRANLGLHIVARAAARCGLELSFLPNEPSGVRAIVSGPVAR